jgi:hypothetical protein
MWLSLAWSSAFARALSFTLGPLAHRVEQGTFNPKVVGSRPTRPTRQIQFKGTFWPIAIRLTSIRDYNSRSTSSVRPFVREV